MKFDMWLMDSATSDSLPWPALFTNICDHEISTNRVLRGSSKNAKFHCPQNFSLINNWFKKTDFTVIENIKYIKFYTETICGQIFVLIKIQKIGWCFVLPLLKAKKVEIYDTRKSDQKSQNYLNKRKFEIMRFFLIFAKSSWRFHDSSV